MKSRQKNCKKKKARDGRKIQGNSFFQIQKDGYTSELSEIMVVCVGLPQVQSNKSLAVQSKTKHNNKNPTPNQDVI